MKDVLTDMMVKRGCYCSGEGKNGKLRGNTHDLIGSITNGILLFHTVIEFNSLLFN
jgi:hypothetical protein